MAQDDVAAFGHLAEPDGDVDAMLDNITNRNQRAGGG